MLKKKATAELPSQEAVVAELHRLNKKLHEKLPVNKIIATLPGLMKHPKGHMKLLEKWLPLAQGHEQELAELLLTLWNVTPQADRGGKTPLELAAAQSPKKPSPATTTSAKSNWTQLMPLLEGVQGLFQDEFFPEYDRLPKKKREVLLNGVHLLFFRYWHTSCVELMDWPPMLAIEQEQRVRKLTLPKGEHIIMRMYRNPELPDDPKYNVRTTFGQEADSFLPLYQDLAQTGDSFFWADSDYKSSLDDLRQHQLGSSKRMPKVEDVFQFTFESCLLQWYVNDEYVEEHFTVRSWYIFWRDMLQRPLEETGDDGHRWWTVDDIFSEVDQRTGQTGTKSLFAFDTMLQGDTTDMNLLESVIGEKGVHENLVAMFYFGCDFFRYFIVPLGLYLPILQPFWQEPMDVAEEIEEFRHAKGSLVEAIAKPPAMIRPTAYGTKLIAQLKPEPRYLGATA